MRGKHRERCMKRMMVLATLCGLMGFVGCAKMEPGQPLQLAPASPAPAERGAEAEKSVPLEQENALEPAAEAEAPATGAPADSDQAAPEEAKQAKEESQPMKRRAAESRESPPKPSREMAPAGPACDATCQKFCGNAKDLALCAQGYAAGCFSGTAPSTFDCEGVDEADAESEGVKARGTPTVTY